VPGPAAVPVVFDVNVLVLAVPELAVTSADVGEPECGLPGRCQRRGGVRAVALAAHPGQHRPGTGDGAEDPG
jgi:hypothetical protein